VNYFHDCHTIEEVRARFRDLAREHHPDHGGDTATMQAVNAEYEEALKTAARAAHRAWTAGQKDAPEYPDWLDEILRDLSAIEEADIELVGTWLYVRIRHGLDAERFRATLARVKGLGLWFSGKHRAWIYNGGRGRKRLRTRLTLDQIRARYGAQVIKEATEPAQPVAIPA
jgi:hypothetical protein